jgi:hypothetical protein
MHFRFFDEKLKYSGRSFECQERKHRGLAIDYGKYFPNAKRGKAHGWLIQQKPFGSAHQCAGYGRHLLLTPGEGAGRAVCPDV